MRTCPSERHPQNHPQSPSWQFCKKRHLSPYRWWLLQTWTQVSARSQLSPSQLHGRSLQKKRVFDQKTPGFATKNIQHGGNLVKNDVFSFTRGDFEGSTVQHAIFCWFSKGEMTSKKMQMLRISWSWLYQGSWHLISYFLLRMLVIVIHWFSCTIWEGLESVSSFSFSIGGWSVGLTNIS